MSDTKILQMDNRDLLILNQANNDFFRVSTEENVDEVIKGFLSNSQFISAYYKISGSHLELKSSHPDTNSKDTFPITGEINPEVLNTLRGFEFKITTVEESNLPTSFKEFLTTRGNETVIVLPINQGPKLYAIILAVMKSASELNEEIAYPLIQLSRNSAIVLRNIELNRTQNNLLNELQANADTNLTILSTDNLDTIFKAIHQKVTSTLGDLEFAVALFNPLNQTIEFPYVVEEGATKSIDPFPLGEGIISVLIRTHQPLMMVSDTEKHLEGLGAKVLGKPAKSWLGCPLNIGDKTIGALIVQDLDHEQRFSQKDLHFLSGLAMQSANVINHLKLIDTTTQNAVELQTVAEISREVSGSLVIDELLRKAVTFLVERLNYYHCAVFLVDPEDGHAALREASGDKGEQLKRGGLKISPDAKTIVGNVLLNKAPLVINDISKETQFTGNPVLSETSSQACFPLMVGDKVLGVLDVHSGKRYEFTSDNTRVLQILSDQLSIALVNSNLFADAQERLSQHRLLHHVTTAAASASSIQDALNSTVQGLQVALGGAQISIMMADREQKTLEITAFTGYPNEESARLKIPFGVGLTGWVASHRQSIRCGDVTKESRYISINPKVRSELAIPLVYRNEVLGVLNVESVRLNAYDENDQEMLGTLAGSLAAIIAHSRLLEQFRQQVERERLLSEITNKVRRTTNPQQILSITAEELSKALNARRTKVEVNLPNLQGSDEKEQDIK